jgi:hypothetical protein
MHPVREEIEIEIKTKCEKGRKEDKRTKGRVARSMKRAEKEKNQG